MSDTITDANPHFRTKQLKDVLSEISNDIETENANEAKPLLSIVTIYDEANERKWLRKYLSNIPHCETDEVEVILCKTFKGKPDSVSLPENTVQNGVKITYCAVCYDEWNFSDARNAAKMAATGEWILSLDTDEYIIQNQIERIFTTIQSKPKKVGAVEVSIVSHIPCTEKKTPEVTRATRLFRNDTAINWQSRIHETVQFSLEEEGFLTDNDSTITLMHEGYEISDSEMIKKLERNLDLIMNEYAFTKKQQIRDYCVFYNLITCRDLYKLKEKQHG